MKREAGKPWKGVKRGGLNDLFRISYDEEGGLKKEGETRLNPKRGKRKRG